MVFNKVRKLLGATVILTVISSMHPTGASFSFSGITPKFSDTKVASFISSTMDKIKDADYYNREEIISVAHDIALSAKTYAAEEESINRFERASIVRVVDGDTIVVDIEGDDLDDINVRLIGINTPESVASEEYLEKKGTTNSYEGKCASDFTKDFLTNYEYVYLESDIQDKDIYGRDLRYVWIEVPTNDYDLSEISTKMLNRVLLSEGYAEVATYYPNTAYEDAFEQIASENAYATAYSFDDNDYDYD